jgi:hypothetical protein
VTAEWDLQVIVGNAVVGMRFDKPLHARKKTLRLFDVQRVAAVFEEFEA